MTLTEADWDALTYFGPKIATLKTIITCIWDDIDNDFDAILLQFLPRQQSHGFMFPK